MSTLNELEKSVLAELKERLEDDPYNEDYQDIIFEIADSSVPVYNYDLLRLAADNIFLAVDEPELGPAFDGTPTPVNIIAANVFEHLESVMYDNVEEIKEELIEELESEEDE